MAVVFCLIFAAFRSSFSSFHQPIHGSFEFDSRRLFELLCFLHNGLFIFRPFRSSPSSMLLIAIDRGFFIILPDGSLILSGGIIFIEMALSPLFLFAFIIHLIVWLLELFDELDDGSVLVVGNIDFIIILRAFDLMLYNNMIGVNIYFLLYLEDLGCAIVRDFVDDFAYINDASYPICSACYSRGQDWLSVCFHFLGYRSLCFSLKGYSSMRLQF